MMQTANGYYPVEKSLSTILQGTYHNSFIIPGTTLIANGNPGGKKNFPMIIHMLYLT